MRSRSSIVALLAAAGALLSPTSARADGAFASDVASSCVTLLAGASQPFSLPANAPALLVVDRTSAGLTSTVTATLISGATRTPLGAPVKDSHGLLTLPLSSPPVGKHAVEIAMVCSTQPDREEKSEIAFTVTDPVALPTQVGALTLVPKSPPTGSDTVRLEPTDGMRAFLAAARLQVSVAGVAADLRFGEDAARALEFAVNTGSVCVQDGALLRDKRTVEVTVSADIAGVADSPEAAKLDVEVDCGAIQWTDGLTAGGEPPPSTPASGEGSSSSGGCSSAPSPERAPLVPVVLALAGLAAMRRRRRA